jgi:hypothetical protein
VKERCSFPPGSGTEATTALSVTPSAGSFGQTVSATATVSSSAGTPSGEVFFSVDGILFDYPQQLNGAGSTAFTINGLAPGNHSVTADYVGKSGAFSPGGTFYEPGSASGFPRRLRHDDHG